MATGNGEVEDGSSATLKHIADTLERISRQVDIVVKLSLRDHQGDRKTIDMIRLLGGLGCSASDIANWLGAPITSVGPILSRTKAAKKTPRQKPKRSGKNAA